MISITISSLLYELLRWAFKNFQTYLERQGEECSCFLIDFQFYLVMIYIMKIFAFFAPSFLAFYLTNLAHGLLL